MPDESPPTIRAALERLIRMLESPRNEYEYYDAMVAARAALAAEKAEGEPSDQDLEAAAREAEVQNMREQGGLTAADPNGFALQYQRQRLAGLRAIYRLNRPAAPPALLEGEVGELVRWLRSTTERYQPIFSDAGYARLTRAAALLSQLSAASPAVVPVPVVPAAVSERPWERPGWCDEQGRCWLQGKVEGDWRLLDPIDTGVPQLRYCFSHSLPAHALPLPPQGGEGSNA